MPLASRVERIADLDARDQPIGRDLRQRHEHEGAFEHVRMRQNEVAIDQHQIVIGEEVDVDGPRPPAALARAVAPERALAFLRARQQTVRRQ